MDATKNRTLYLYCHYGGEFKIESNQSAHYVGGRTVGVRASECFTFHQLSEAIYKKLSIWISNHVVKYSLTFDPTQLVDLSNDDDLKDLLSFTDKFGHVYIFGGDVEARLDPQAQPSPHVLAQPDHVETQPDPHVEVQPDPHVEVQPAQHVKVHPDHVKFQPAQHVKVHPDPNVEVQPDPHGGSNASNVGQSDRSSCVDKDSSDDEHRKTLSRGTSMSSAFSQRWKNEISESGQLFEDINALRQAIFQFSISNKFNYKFLSNSKKQLNVRCQVDGCEWHLTAYRVGSSDMMMIGTFINEHTHSTQDVTTRCRVKSKLLAPVISNKFKLQPDTTPNDIKTSVEAEYGIKMTYAQAWRCKEKLTTIDHGKVEDNYKEIPWLCSRIMEVNEHNVAKWMATADHRFDKLFVSYGCSALGFLHGCRPLLFVDGCRLNGPYKGILLSASSLDASNCLFPLAYAFVSSDSYENWSWFLENLKSLIGSVKVVIISDRHPNIIESVGQVYDRQYHAYCYRHLKEDFSAEVNKLLSGRTKAKEQALKLLDKVAYGRLDKEYIDALDVLRQLNPGLAEWVIANEPEHWVMSKFPHPRWDHLSNNVAESFNEWIVKERCYSISNFIIAQREKLAKKFHKAKLEITSWSNGIGPKIEEQLLVNIASSEPCIVSTCGLYIAKVSTGFADLVVDISTRTCTCTAWQMSGIPCPHACAAIKHFHGNIYEFVDEFYTIAKQQLIYANSMVVETHDIFDLEKRNAWTDESEILLLPPITKRTPGRPQVRQIESQFTKKRKTYCSRCGKAGHNRATCKKSNPD